MSGITVTALGTEAAAPTKTWTNSAAGGRRGGAEASSLARDKVAATALPPTDAAPVATATTWVRDDERDDEMAGRPCKVSSDLAEAAPEVTSSVAAVKPERRDAYRYAIAAAKRDAKWRKGREAACPQLERTRGADVARRACVPGFRILGFRGSEEEMQAWGPG